jgi:hypothetical protein
VAPRGELVSASNFACSAGEQAKTSAGKLILLM